MPRNSSGTYSLPAGNPVVSGTLIEASWANTTLSDLASAITDSLSRSGEGGMTAALRLYDGTVSVPGLAFSNETSTGLYRAGAGDMRLSVTGSEVVKFLNTGVAVTGTLSASGAATLSSTLAVTGASTFTGAATFNATTTTFENATAYYPQLINRNKTNDANGSYISLQKIRSTSIVQNGDVLGNLIFSGYDGAAYLQGAYINAVVSAAPGTNDMPTDLAFGTTPDGSAGPSERLRITQAGNVGIGTSSPAYKFHVVGGNNNSGRIDNDGSQYTTLFWGNNGTNKAYFAWDNTNTAIITGSDVTNSIYTFKTNNAERMRIDSSGNLLVGTTSSIASTSTGIQVVSTDWASQFYTTAVSGSGLCLSARRNNNGVVAAFLYNGSAYGSAVGNISITSSATTYATSSDYRLKENVQPMTGALDTVAQLKPCTYTWKADGSDGQGFIAHELQEVVPDAVVGEKDALDADGNPVYQGIDTSFLVATLTAAIQEQQALITTLTERISALEATP